MVTPIEERPTPGEWCKKCDRRVVVGFLVPDEVWNAVVGDPDTCWCLTCFDEEAQRLNVSYTIDPSDLFAVTWSMWTS